MPPSAGQRTADFTGQESIVGMPAWMRACCNRLAVSSSLSEPCTDASQPAVYEHNYSTGPAILQGVCGK